MEAFRIFLSLYYSLFFQNYCILFPVEFFVYILPLILFLLLINQNNSIIKEVIISNGIIKKVMALNLIVDFSEDLALEDKLPLSEIPQTEGSSKKLEKLLKIEDFIKVEIALTNRANQITLRLECQSQTLKSTNFKKACYVITRNRLFDLSNNF